MGDVLAKMKARCEPFLGRISFFAMSKSVRAVIREVPERTPRLSPQSATQDSLRPAARLSTSPSTIVFFDHTAKWSGGEISLFNLVTNLDKTRFRAVVVLFEDGILRHKLEAAGIETRVVPLDTSLNSARKNALKLPLFSAPRQIRHLLRHVRALR